MNSAPTPTDIQKRTTAKMLFAAAVRLTVILDKFGNWMALSLGAILAFIIGNIDKLKNFMDAGKIKIAALIYIVTLLLVLLQKRINVLILSADAGDKAFSEAISTSGPDAFNLEFHCEESLDASYYPRKWLLKSMFDELKTRARNGDIVWFAKKITKAVQRQEIYCLFQAVTTLVIVYLLATAIY